MGKLTTYTSKGTKSKSKLTFPKELQEEINMQLLAQAIRVYEHGMHSGNSKAKTRSEVRASTRKIYRQKGTGRARHGALSAPLFVGGGQAHGPDGRKRTLRMNKKMARKALKIALSIKQEDNEMAVVSGAGSIKKTKQAANLIDKIVNTEKKSKKGKKDGEKKKAKKKPRVTFVLSEENKDIRKFIRNIENVTVEYFKDLNAFKVFFGGFLIVDKDVFGNSKKKGK